jgi:hypothetical protein
MQRDPVRVRILANKERAELMRPIRKGETKAQLRVS